MDDFILVIITTLSIFALYKIFRFLEMAYVEYVKKQLFYNHIYFRTYRLNNEQRSYLQLYFTFYNRLTDLQKGQFEHRVSVLIKRTEFIGKQIDITEEMKVLIMGTLAKLTFGLRDYKINSVERILIYPTEFYSPANKTYHKGEFNLGYKALVFSWEDVLHGYDVADDNINLAVHEFTHALHFYYMRVRRSSTSAAIFLDSHAELFQELNGNPDLKHRLEISKFLREYAFTNQFEFLSVILETFIESPQEFKSQFPEIYKRVKTMLNFNFSEY